MVTELLNKYIWLVNTFVRTGERGLSLDEICLKWENRFGSCYSRRTFNNHREAVEEVFGIRIGCNRSTNRYFVEYGSDVADENAETAWLINTFTVNNMLSLGKERLSGRVSVEDIPSGHLHLTSIMEAMTENENIITQHTARYAKCLCTREDTSPGTDASRIRASQTLYWEIQPLTRSGILRSAKSPTGSDMRSINGLRHVVMSDTPTTIWYIGLCVSPVAVM